MADVQHRDLGVGSIHSLVNWEHNDANERLSEAVTISDLNKISKQLDTGAFYILINDTPTWLKILVEGDDANPTGLAGGDLSGFYPDPSVVADSHTHSPGVTIPAYPTTLPPSGSAGGDLTGTYPNPSLTSTGVVAGNYNRATVTVNSKGRITSITSNTDPPAAGNPFPGFNNVTLTGNAQTDPVPYDTNSERIATTRYVTQGQIRRESLPSSETLIINSGYQKVVNKVYLIEGSIVIRGALVIQSLPETDILPNFLAPNADPLFIPKDYFKIVLNGYRMDSPIIIYGILKII